MINSRLKQSLKVEYIISRYNEDVNWATKAINEYDKLTIYNKGKTLDISKNSEVVNLPNVDREGHTYLYHIISNYDSLAEISVFLQGRIDDLVYPAFNPLYLYVDMARIYGFGASHIKLVGPTYWSNNPFNYEGNGRHALQLQSGEMLNTSETMLEFFYRFLGPVPILSAVSYCGCFSVKKELILSRPITFYKNLFKEINKHPNPLAGHYLERMWLYIFTGTKNLKYISKIPDSISCYYQ